MASRLRLTALALLAFHLTSALSPQTRSNRRQFWVYSTVREDEDQWEGVELELVLWENAADVMFTVYRPYTPAQPVRLSGERRDDEIVVTVTQRNEALEIRGTCSPERFRGNLVFRQEGKTLRNDPLDLPRKKLRG